MQNFGNTHLEERDVFTFVTLYLLVQEQKKSSSIKLQLYFFISDVMLSRQLDRKHGLGVAQLILDFKDLDIAQGSQNFMDFMSTQMDPAACKMIEKLTTAQSRSALWFTMKYGRVTASKLHEAAHCQTGDGSYVKSVFGAKPFKGNAATKRGSDLEADVKRRIRQLLGIRIYNTGIVLSSKYPIFGASPDGLTKTHVIEIKCPTSEAAFNTYFKENNQPSDKHKAQMHLQMLLTGRKKGYFCVASPKFESNKYVKIVEVDFDEQYCNTLIEAATKFWMEHIFPRLYRQKM